jgi:hypothetical protein
MASWDKYKSEVIISVFLFVYLLFTLTNVNSNLGNAYLWFLGISVILLLINILVFDKDVRITFQKEKGKWLNVIFAGIIAWVAVLVTSFVVFKVVNPEQANFASIISSFGAANPAFSSSKILNWFTVSFAIGFSETNFFAGRILEFVADLLRIPLSKNNLKNLKFVMLAISLGVLFAFFHATAKGVAATNSLIVVAIMMIISIFMVAYYGETRQAIAMHVISNGVAGIMLLMAGGTLFG